jgi:hypothetical protein
LNGGEQQSDEDGDDRDHHQQFDEGEPSLTKFQHGRLLNEKGGNEKSTNVDDSLAVF